MKALYYDCFAGLSGDMNLGAMIDLGVDIQALKTELSKLGLDAHFQIQVRKDEKHGIYGTKADVIDLSEAHGHAHAHDHHHHHHDAHAHDHAHTQDHDHVHHSHDPHAEDAHTHDHAHDHASAPEHHHRTFKDIRALIEQSTLSEWVKQESIAVFHTVAVAEGKIHNKPIDAVHFHEVGAIDSIIDIVGAAICLELLGVRKIIASTVEVGSGFVKCAHGMMPIPAPATAEILRGVPIKSNVQKFEMTTPTGAAILKTWCDTFTDEKNFTTLAVGYGLGTRNLDIPNLVRVFLIDLPEGDEKKSQQWLIETNIDDMSAELLVYAEERLFETGALDVFKTPIIMKKGRPAIKLSVLAKAEDLKKLQRVLVLETTSIGMRMFPVEKVKLNRSYEQLETPFGPISLKLAYFEEELVNIKPEYEHMKRIAKEKNMPIKDVYEIVQNSIHLYKKGK